MAAEISYARPQAKVDVHGEDDQLGMFKVVANGKVVWDKYQTHEFPDPATLIATLPKPTES